MRKSLVYCVLFILAINLFSLVSAQSSTGLDGMINNIGGMVKTVYDTAVVPLAQWLIGGETASGVDGAQNFFTLILLFVLLMSVLWMVLERVPMLNQNNWVQFIVTFAVSLISIRFIGASGNSSWFEAILLPNQVLGISILCLLPLVFYFVFVETVGENKPALRKILFVFAAIVFIILYLVRYDAVASANGGFNAANIYFFAALASFGLMFADGTINRAWSSSRADAALAGGRNRLARQLLREIDLLEEDWAHGRITDFGGHPDRARYNREKEDLRRRYLELTSH